MSSELGSLVLALFCAARKMSLSRAIASSRAAMLLSRPTKSCDTMCGDTMMSRSGRAGSVLRPGAGLSEPSFLKNISVMEGYHLRAEARGDERRALAHRRERARVPRPRDFAARARADCESERRAQPTPASL